MNKILFRLIGVIATAIYSMSAYAETFEVGGIYYEIDTETPTSVRVVKDPDGYKGTITIPSQVTHNGKMYSVKELSKDAFSSCRDLESVILNEGLLTIGNSCFSHSGLKSYNIPNTVETIGNYAFYNTDISEVHIPSSVNSIGTQAFSSCELITSITVDAGNVVYDSRNNSNAIIKGNTLLFGCINTSFPESVSIIGEAAFYGTNITSITVPSTIAEIGKDAFGSCRKLESVILNEGLVTIGNSSFSHGGLKSYNIPNTVETIGNYAFYNTDISEVHIPSSVNSIGTQAFSSCELITSITVDAGNVVYDSRNNSNAIIKGNTLLFGCINTSFPESVSIIGEAAFYGTNITSITVPSTIAEIGKDAFGSCRKLESVILNEGLVTIGNSSFSHGGLLLVVIPHTVESIGNYAFYGNQELKEIEISVNNPFAINDNVFSDKVFSTAILSVPKEQINDYKATNGWKNFVNIQGIEPEPTPVFDNMTFVIHKWIGMADLQIAKSSEHVVIPETIEYDGNTYAVTRILDSALEGSNMISLSIPSSVTYIGHNSIKDCNQLAAIEWNPKFNPSTEFVGHIVNPNLLFYVTEEQFKPDGIRNVIIGDQASSITLTDETNGNFYCPKVFTAGNITYTHNYSLPTEKGLAKGWESIVLPFNVTTIKTANGEEIKPVFIAGTGEKRFWLKELKETGLEEASEIKANVPYIISMPNWDGYQDFYNITGDVTFSAQNVMVQTSDNLQASASGNYQFTPNYQAQDKQNDIWALNTSEYAENGKTYAPGSIFKANLRNVRPFEAYLTASGSAAARRCISIADLMDGATAIADIPVRGERIYSDNGMVYIESAADGNYNIYSMSGLLMRKLALKKGMNCINGLSKGVYIINGNKVLVK